MLAIPPPASAQPQAGTSGHDLGQVGGEYSVVNQDLFGQRFQFRIQITPVIPSLIRNPILGRRLPVRKGYPEKPSR